MSVFQIVFLGTHDTGSFSSGHGFGVCEVVAPGPRKTPLLEMREILHHDPLLLAGDGPVTGLRHQVQHSLAIFLLAAMVTCHVMFEVILADEVCIAELTDQRWTQDGPIIEVAKSIPSNVVTGHVTELSGNGLAGIVDALLVLSHEVVAE